MKNSRILLIVLCFMLLLTAGLAHNTLLEEQREQYEAKLEMLQQERDRVLAENYWLGRQKEPEPFIWPVDRIYISSVVGYRKDPLGGSDHERLHKGYDLVGPIGTPVKCVKDGQVMEHWLVPGWHGGVEYFGHPVMGGFIVIQHRDGTYSLYGHLSETTVHEGMFVKAGQVIGAIGNTGISTGSHLHFELVVDPFQYLTKVAG